MVTFLYRATSFVTPDSSPTHRPWVHRTTGALPADLYPVISENPLGSDSNTARQLVGKRKETIWAVMTGLDALYIPLLFVKISFRRNISWIFLAAAPWFISDI